jgi:2-oxoglutarate ferredoxin oxidoreductase subunit delta
MKVFARTPLDLAEKSVPRGQVYIIPNRCKGCNLCIHFCPCHVLQESVDINAKGYHYPELISAKEAACVHCDFCTLICPEFAIYTLEVD